MAAVGAASAGRAGSATSGSPAVRSTGAAGAGFCDACLTGNYPVPVPLTLTKSVLER